MPKKFKGRLNNIFHGLFSIWLIKMNVSIVVYDECRQINSAYVYFKLFSGYFIGVIGSYSTTAKISFPKASLLKEKN